MDIRLDSKLRIESQMDPSSPTKYIVTLKLDGEPIRQFEKYGGPEVRDEMIRATVRWLATTCGHPGPSHYYYKVFPDSRRRGTWKKRPIRPLLHDSTA